ncbi:MAG: CmcJ/NvfI family oxidoreductase [Kiloniellales bacterium]
MDSVAETTKGRTSQGAFHYMSESAEHSLYRNGKVLTRRDLDGSDAEWKGVDLEARSMAVTDARTLPEGEGPSLATNGFAYHAQALATPDLDFLAHETVIRDYYPQCTELVRAASGARLVAAFDHNVRSASGKKSKQRIEGGQQVQGPAHVVHGDYTLTSAPQRLRDLTRPPSSNDTLSAVLGADEALLDKDEVEEAITKGRFAIINVWRNIAAEPVATHPLALCAADSVKPEDLVVFEIHYKDRIGENYFAKYAERHRWYFFSGMTRDETLLIKQWDSAGRLAETKGAEGDAAGSDRPCTFSFHSAFEDPATPPDAPDRWSIEVRCVALFD